jgi:hypothetical protein
MKFMRAFLIVWLAGVVAGAVLMERWRRHGGRYMPVEPESAPSPIAVVATPSAGQPNVVRLVVAGAKLDAERVRQRLGQAKSNRQSAPGSAGSGAQ